MPLGVISKGEWQWCAILMCEGSHTLKCRNYPKNHTHKVLSNIKSTLQNLIDNGNEYLVMGYLIRFIVMVGKKNKRLRGEE